MQVTASQIFRELDDGKWAPFYLIVGEEPFQAGEILDRLKKFFKQGDFNSDSFDGEHLETLSVPPIDTPNTHGTGCTLSAAIAAQLALGRAPLDATRRAKDYVTAALRHPLALGRGNGPFSHFFPLGES
jgi:hypothetical protein